MQLQKELQRKKKEKRRINQSKMALKVVKATKEIIESSEASKYSSDEIADSFKGKIVVLQPEESEVAKNLKITKKGSFAIKI